MPISLSGWIQAAKYSRIEHRGIVRRLKGFWCSHLLPEMPAIFASGWGRLICGCEPAVTPVWWPRYIFIWVTDKIIVILISLWCALAFPRLHKTFITDRGRPYTDTPFVILPGMLKSSQPIGDDPNLWMALSLTYNFVRYSYDQTPIQKRSAIQKVWFRSCTSETIKTTCDSKSYIIRKMFHLIQIFRGMIQKILRIGNFYYSAPTIQPVRTYWM